MACCYVIYHRVSRLFEALAIAKGDGRHARMLKAIAKTEVLILDDWGLSVLTAMERRDMLEILEDRHGRGSTIVNSQLPVGHWHEAVGDPTLADAILDRLIHNAHRLALSGESIRKRNGLTKTLDPVGQDWLYATLGQSRPLPRNGCPQLRETRAHNRVKSPPETRKIRKGAADHIGGVLRSTVRYAELALSVLQSSRPVDDQIDIACDLGHAVDLVLVVDRWKAGDL